MEESPRAAKRPRKADSDKQVEYFEGILRTAESKAVAGWKPADLSNASRWAWYLDKRGLQVRKPPSLTCSALADGTAGDVHSTSAKESLLHCMISNPFLSAQQLAALAQEVDAPLEQLSETLKRRLQRNQRSTQLIKICHVAESNLEQDRRAIDDDGGGEEVPTDAPSSELQEPSISALSRRVLARGRRQLYRNALKGLSGDTELALRERLWSERTDDGVLVKLCEELACDVEAANDPTGAQEPTGVVNGADEELNSRVEDALESELIEAGAKSSPEEWLKVEPRIAAAAAAKSVAVFDMYLGALLQVLDDARLRSTYSAKAKSRVALLRQTQAHALLDEAIVSIARRRSNDSPHLEGVLPVGNSKLKRAS